MRHNWVKKGLVVSVILLFVGVTIAPNINFNVVKATNGNDLIEVTTQACGIKGFGDTTVKLTKQQYQNLEGYLVDFRARLNKTTTREEAVPLFKEAVVELNKYGLLPKGMSVEQTQKLVTGGYYNVRINRTFQRLYDTNDYLIKSNFLCLITGRGGNFHIKGIIPFIKESIYWWLWPLELSPLNWVFFGRMTFGSSYIEPSEWEQVYSPATGWVNTYGLTGIKEWNGTFFGGCGITFPAFQNLYYEYIGAYGFTGMGITTNWYHLDFFIGTALWARMRYA